MPKKTKVTMPNPMTEEQEALFVDAYQATAELVDALKDEADANGGRLPCREFSIVLTKLEEAELWLRRGFEEMEYEVPRLDVEDEEDAEEEADPDTSDGDAGTES